MRRLLEEDEDFRTRVRDAVVELPGREDLGRASLLFLERPDGWEAELEALVDAAEAAAEEEAAGRAASVAARRLAAVEAALTRAEADLAPLRATVERLRGELAEARRARRTVESDAGRLRKRIAELEAQVGALAGRAGADDVAGRAAAVAAAEARAEAAEVAAAEAEARAGAALEAAAAARRPPPAQAPAPPEVDHRAAADAVSGAVEAVQALAAALGRAADALTAHDGAPPWPPEAADRTSEDRPPRALDRVQPSAKRAPVALPPALFDDTVEAVEHLLRVPGATVFVDGYNVTLTTRGELALPDQRRWLVDAVGRASARTGAEFQVVFDGALAERTAAERRHLGVRVRFTSPDVEADDEILALVAGLPADRPAVVVSDDRRVRDGARRLGANVIGVGPLVASLRGSPS